MIIIYAALLNSKTTYGFIVRGGAYDCELKKILDSQNRLLDIIDSTVCKPLSRDEMFILEFINFNCSELKVKFETSNIPARNMNIE